MAKQIPVYLFVGQLESGKTKFIQETMEDPNFDSGDKTLLLVCEEGELEYDPSRFAFGGVHVAQMAVVARFQVNLEGVDALSVTHRPGFRRIIDAQMAIGAQQPFAGVPGKCVIVAFGVVTAIAKLL